MISESDSNEDDSEMIAEDDPELTMLNDQLNLLKQDFQNEDARRELKENEFN